jgi:hypothetical protein
VVAAAPRRSGETDQGQAAEDATSHSTTFVTVHNVSGMRRVRQPAT